ncbi:MAG: hypothetical protein RDU01_02690 [Thermodesulfovibrionales bacterium]|nr:hypothetical protein [Thermodesulfovibrionales bacterium]
MKKRFFLLFLLYILVMSVALYGCGSGAGAPGSKGIEDTGVQLSAVVNGVYLGASTNSVDVFQDLCDPGPPPKYEVFTDHQAEVTFTASLINPNPTIKPGTLYIDKYTIEYKRSNDSLGAPPIEKDTRFETIIISPPLSGNGTTSLIWTIALIDLPRKEKYGDDVLSGRYDSHLAYINNYTAIFTFYGKNEYGEAFTVKTQMNFQIGWFDNC